MNLDYEYVADENGEPITHETFFERFGIETFASDVPHLVRQGYTVWSYQYGQETNDDPGYFNAIEESDLDAWLEDTESDIDGYWGPFAYDPYERNR